MRYLIYSLVLISVLSMKFINIAIADNSEVNSELPYPTTVEQMRDILKHRDMDAIAACDDSPLIAFDRNSSAIIPPPGPGLSQILEVLTIPPLEYNEHITITGHTDSDGSGDCNM